MKTRIRHLSDGAREVIRLISPKDLDGFDKDDPLLFEKSIVWLEDVAALPFVRVKMVRTALSRRGAITLGDGGRVVGYAKLTPNAPQSPASHGYRRRVFYLKTDDAADRDTSLADPAYDPRTIFPGEKGRQLRTAALRVD